MVESELETFRQFEPDGVYCGLNLSSMISVPHARLPMITLVPTALCPAFFQQGLASFPDAMDTLWLRRLVPRWVKRKLINRIMLGNVAKKSATIFNRVRERYGLGPILNFTSLVRGDLTLLPDLPEMSGLASEHLPPGYSYTGPLFAHLELPIPEAAKRVFDRPGPRVYCAMGSSGTPELLQRVVAILRSVPTYNVVCATTNIVDPDALGPPADNFFATRFLPAHLVNELGDVAVIHGGQGTVQTAVWAGTPVVGIGLQWEQQANLDGLERAGAGVRLPLHQVERETLLEAVEQVRQPAYRERIRSLQKKVRASDGAAEAVRQMNAFVRARMASAPAKHGLARHVTAADPRAAT
jgi:UDP:flavonoid glycosyltransferase YjiC (YdhE family)